MDVHQIKLADKSIHRHRAVNLCTHQIIKEIYQWRILYETSNPKLPHSNGAINKPPSEVCETRNGNKSFFVFPNYDPFQCDNTEGKCYHPHRDYDRCPYPANIYIRIQCRYFHVSMYVSKGFTDVPRWYNRESEYENKGDAAQHLQTTHCCP